MKKIRPKTCFGCKAICTKGCTLGFAVKKKREGFGDDSRLTRTPLEPCYKPQTGAAYVRAVEITEGMAAA